MAHWRFRGALVLLCLGGAALASSPAPAETQGREHFEAGTSAYRTGDYAAALTAFRAALEAGLTGPAVHFNVGVCAWELGLLDEAEAAFLVVSEHPPMAGIAFYNLGLVSQRRGHEDQARAWFLRARSATTDAGLQRLVAAQLEKSPVEAPVAVRPAPRPLVFAALQAGYDDNVALTADGELLGVSDTGSGFADLQIAAAAPLRAGLRVEATAFLLRHTTLSEFDQAGGQLALMLRHDLGDWMGEIGAGYGINQLDGSRFEDRRSLTFSATRRLDPSWDLRLRYRFEDIRGRAPFGILTGDRHEVSVRVHRRAETSRLRLTYSIEINDRESDFVSPDRHQVDAEWTLGTRGRIQTVLGLGWRRSSFALDDGSENETRSVASVGLLGPLAGRWLWTARYDWTRNSATNDAFDYDRQRVFAGLEAVF